MDEAIRVKVTVLGDKRFRLEWVREHADRFEVINTEVIRIPDDMLSCVTQIRIRGEIEPAGGVVWIDQAGLRHFVTPIDPGSFTVVGQDASAEVE